MQRAINISFGGLDALGEQTEAIAANLKTLEGYRTGFDPLETQTDATLANLQTIQGDETGLEELKARLDRMLEKLERRPPLREEPGDDA